LRKLFVPPTEFVDGGSNVVRKPKAKDGDTNNKPMRKGTPSLTKMPVKLSIPVCWSTNVYGRPEAANKFIRGDTLVERLCVATRILASLFRQSEGIPRDRSREYILVEFIEQEKLALVTFGEVFGKTMIPQDHRIHMPGVCLRGHHGCTDAYIVDGSIGLNP